MLIFEFLKQVPAPIVHRDNITIYFPPKVSSLRTSKQIIPSILYNIYEIFDEHTRITYIDGTKKNKKLNHFILYLRNLYEI